MNVKILGDPHLGRTFIHGVPLARRGEREIMVWNDFQRSLLEENHDVDIHINLGDLFDAAVVSYDVLMKAASTYAQAALAYPGTRFIVLRGNHDLLRDLEKKSAFDVFEELMGAFTNVTVVKNTVIVVGRQAFIGFDPVTPAAELLPDSLKGRIDTVYGHWDTEAFGSVDMPNLIPTARMAELGITSAVTGHVHRPDKFERDGVAVTVHGSMQPYAHGQDPDGSLYVSLSLVEALAQKDDLKNKCVRLELQPGESLEDELDCLQLQIRYPQGQEDEVLPPVQLGDFNLVDLFKEAMAEAEVAETFQKQVLDEFSTRRLEGAA